MATRRIVKILTWNINSGHGARGKLRDRIDNKLLLENLERIAFVIEKSDADVVCLQEVDKRWEGTRNIDQRKHLQKELKFPYSNGTIHLRPVISPWVRRVIGNSMTGIDGRYLGTVILSRHRIKKIERHTFGQNFGSTPVISEVARLLNESKGFTRVEIEVEGRLLSIISAHLLNDVFYEIFRHLHQFSSLFPAEVRGRTAIRKFQMRSLLSRVATLNHPVIIGADCNMVPPESEKLNFKDCRDGDPDDYSRDTTMQFTREAGAITTIPELFGNGTPEEIKRFYTYPTLSPDRVLDYVFVTNGLRIVDYTVLADGEILRRKYEVMPSDHLPVLATVEI